MKIKIALVGLFFANSIVHSTYADQYLHPLEEEIDDVPIIEKDDAEKEEKEKAAPENLLKSGATVTMGPRFTYQDKEWSTKNSLGVDLTFKAEIPKAWCNKDATLDIGSSWDGKSFAIKKATINIGKMVKIGHTSTIFGYEKADPALLISVGPAVLQIKHTYAFEWFRMSYAIEKPVGLEVGLFDKTKSEDKNAKKGSPNRLDDVKNKDRAFKINNRIPALGLNLGVVTDEVNLGLSGLMRCTDYTHSTDSNEKHPESILYFTYGGNLGIQYKVVPEKCTVTAQGVGLHGLGDYISGLSAFQKDDEREEMCAVYYKDTEKDSLSAINAWGAGGTLEYCATPKWTFSLRGSYLTTLKDANRPAHAFRAQWHIVPKVAYAVNKYFTLSGNYTLAQEFKVDEKKDKGIEHKISGSIKFSL